MQSMHNKSGGFRQQRVDPLEHARMPAKAKSHQLAGEAKGYRERAIEDGILPRQGPRSSILLKA